jgi:hypothetical protein
VFPGGLYAIGAPAVAVVVLALAMAILAVGDGAFGIILERRAMVVAGLEEHLASDRRLGALARIHRVR